MTNADRKYRPSNIEEYVGNKSIVREVMGYIKTGDIPHMMFVGPPGVGKNTLAYIFATELFGREIELNTEDDDQDYKELNASKDRGIDVVRHNIVPFMETSPKSSVSRRVIFLDEFDSMTRPAQLSLKSAMEKHEDNCIVIMSLNEISGVKVDALFSRSSVFRFKKPKKSEIAGWFRDVCKSEGIFFPNKNMLKDVVDYYDGDLRHILVDCLEGLKGYAVGKDRYIVKKKDLHKIYEDTPEELVHKVATADNPKKAFFSAWRGGAFNERHFLEKLHREMHYKHSRVFAEVDARLRSGANAVVQFSYLFDVIQNA